MRRSRGIALALAAALSVGSLAGVASAADPDPCSGSYVAPMNSTAKLQQYVACRENRQDQALKRIEDKLGGPTPSPGPTSSPSQTPTASPTPIVTPKPSPTPSDPPTTTSPSPTSTPTAPTGGIVVLGRTFPDATTTGVPAGTNLTPYTGSCTLSNPNAAPLTIDRKTITCEQFRILQPNVTITNSVINGTIFSDCCYLNGSFTLTDSEVHGPKSTATVVGEARFTLTRVEVDGGSRAVYCNTDCTVKDSYLHGQYTDKRGIDHESGMRMDQSTKILHNTITCDATPVPPDAGCSAAITGYGDFGVVQNNTIDNNLIDGGPDGSMGYCVYGGSVPGKPYPHANHIVYTNNVFRRGPSGVCGIWGPVSDFDSTEPGNVWTGNIWDTDGTTVPPDH